MNGEISELLKRYGTSLEETRAMMPKLSEAVKRKRAIKPPAIQQAPQLFDPAEAKEFGVQLDPGWTLKVTPPVDGQEPKISFITPENWEITQEGTYISPEGKTFTREELEAQMAVPEVPVEGVPEAMLGIERVFGKVFPTVEDAGQVLTWASESEENLNEFLELVHRIGRTEDTEDLLSKMFPEITPEEIGQFFAPVAEEVPRTLIGQAWDIFWAKTPWLAKPTEPAFWEPDWKKGIPGFMDLMEWLAPTKVGAAMGVLGAFLEQFVGRPWEVALLESNCRSKGTPISVYEPNEWDELVIDTLDKVFAKYGWTGIFSEEVGQLWEVCMANLEPGKEWERHVLEWGNPVYWVPVGSAFGLGAKFTSKIPIIGRGMRYTAAGVQAVERGIVYPIAKPAELGLKGLERVGARLGEKMIDKVIKQTEHLQTLLELPTSERVLEGLLVDNWMRRTLQFASKLPPIRKGIERGLGYRVLVKRGSEAVEDIVGRAAVINSYFRRMGINAKAPKLWELRAISGNPVKLFGFNKQAYSPKMVERLLPEYKGLAEAGTLEHVFTHPEMYSWKGMQRGLEYVTKVHEMNTQVLNLLKAEGVPPKTLTEDWWIHRVVEGKFDPEGELIALRTRPGVRGRGRVGATPSYEMHRQAPTMAEGIAWGVQYGRNPELAITTYIEEAFKKIADARAVKYLEPFGILPSERLAERFPEVVERAALTQVELADAAKFESVINRAIRGEKLPGGTLKAIEGRFPELGKRLRALSEAPPHAENQLRALLKESDKTIRELQRQIKKAEAVDLKTIRAKAEEKGRAVALKEIPDEKKLAEAFRVMDYDDRLAFRNTMESQLDDIGRMAGEQEMQLRGIEEFLASDPVALYRGHIGKRKVSLIQFVRKGEFPESFTVKEAKMLMMGKQPRTVIKGRVPRDVVLDELAEHFGMSEQQLIDHILSIAEQQTMVGDLRYLIKVAQNRQTAIKRMLGVLDNVDAAPEYLIKPTEYARPYEPPTPAKPTEFVEYKPAFGVKTKLKPAEAFEQLDRLTAELELTKTRLARLRATQKRQPDWKAYDRYADDVVGIDVRIEEQEAVLGMLQDELTALEKGIEKAGALRPAPAELLPEVAPPVVRPGTEAEAFTFAKRQYEPYVARGDTIESMKAGHLGVGTPEGKMTTGAYFQGKKIKPNQVGVELPDGSAYIFKLEDIVKSIKEAPPLPKAEMAIAREAYPLRPPIDKATWERLSVAERASLVKSLGMEGKVGSKAWDKLTGEELRNLTTELPRAEAMMPEAGLQKDIFGYETPYYPKGKGEVTQIGMDDYAKLVELRAKEGLPPPDVAIKPKVEGVKGLEGETTIQTVRYKPPPVKSVNERKAGLEALRLEVRALKEARKAPYWQARTERALRMEQVRQPGIGEGYIMQPFAGGRIYDQVFIDSFNKFFGHDAGLGVLKVTSDVAGILRITKAALDLSMMAIQGLPSFGLAHAYMLVNPVIGARLMGAWWKAFGYSIGAFFDQRVLAGVIKKNEASALQRIAFGGSARAVDYFAALEARRGLGGLGEKAMAAIPLKPYHRAETAFFGAGEIVRDEFWRILSPRALARGQEFELARLLDRFTGISDSAALGVPLTVRQLEQSFFWFAPNYTRACLDVLSMLFRGGLTGAEARKALGGMIAAGSVYYTGIQYAISSMEGKSHEEAMETVKEGFCIYEDPITGETEWRPSARFMTIKIGNYYFGFGGFWYGLMRLGGNVMACINEVGERERIDLVRIMKHGSLNKKDNPFIYWWYTRASPFFGSIFELASGKDFLGYPIETPMEYAKHIVTRFEPIWMEQGLNWLIPGMAREQEIPEDVATATALPIFEIFGLRTFPESTWVLFYDKVNEYIKTIPEEELDEKQKEAWRDGKLKWQHLTQVQKLNLLSRYPELQEFYQEAQADSAIRSSPHWKAWEGVTTEAKDTYYERGDNLWERVQTRDIDTRELREMWSEAGQNYGIALDTIEKDPHYEEVYRRFEVLEEKGEKYEFKADMALAEYNKIMFTEYLDEKGDIDWDRKDAEVDAFIEKWGEDMYTIIREMYAQKRLLEGLPLGLVRLAEDKEKLGREYWRLPYKPIKDMDEEDEAEGNIPAEYKTLWKQYQALETDKEREAFLEKHPLLAKDWRAEYRYNNPEADARLALWGYGGKLQTMEAYELVVQWGRELGIPVEQMGLGLPPRSLIDEYFEHAVIVRETSGGSIEARLYKLEHPDWLEWGVENWGWSDLSGENISALRLRVEHKDLFAQYEGYGDRHSELYIKDDKARAEARDKLLDENPVFRDDRRRVEAYQLGFPDEQIESYVEYANMPAKGFGQERYLLEHPEFYKSMIELKDIVPFDPDYKVPDARYDEIYEKWEDLFEQYEAVTGTESQRARARAKILQDNPEFAFDRRRREAYGKFIPEEHVDTYAEWFTTRPQKSDDPWYLQYPDETYYGDDWWLMEHMEFYSTMWAMGLWEERDFSKVPTRAVFELYKTYKGLPTGTPRYDFRAKHLDLDAWLVIKFGYKPIAERGKKEAEKTEWEKAEEARRFIEKF